MLFRKLCQTGLLLICLMACTIAPTASTPPTQTLAPPNTPTTEPTQGPLATITSTLTPQATLSPSPAQLTATTETMQAINQQLIQAAERGDTEAVLRLLQVGAEIDVRDARGRTPVLAATHSNAPATVQALIQQGANIHLQDDLQDNVFLYAGAEGLLEILRLAIAAGADTTLTNRFGGTALIPAAERGHIAVVQELLTHTDIDVNHVNNLGWTALLEAIILGDGGPRHVEVVRLLIEAGADVNLADSNGVTPLAHAQQRGFTQMMALLQLAGAR